MAKKEIFYIKKSDDGYAIWEEHRGVDVFGNPTYERKVGTWRTLEEADRILRILERG